MTDARFTQQYLEAIENEAASEARITQQYLEAIQYDGPSEVRVMQQYIEVIVKHVSPVSPVWGWANGGPAWHLV